MLSIFVLRPRFLIILLSILCASFGLSILTALAAPSTPGALTSPNWQGDHYVSGDFTLQTTGSTPGNKPIAYYKLCRSQDANLNELRGCEVWVTSNNGLSTSFSITGTHRPSASKQRWYYVVAVDTGAQEAWSGAQYVRDMALDTTAPTAPGAPTTIWQDDHYVTGNFTLTTSGATDAESGVAYYKLCRSQDANLNEWRGCEVWVSENTPSSLAVSGTHLPTNGKTRWYYFYAVDNKGNLSASSSGTYLRLDSTLPLQNSLTTSSANWEYNNVLTYDITVKVTEEFSGLKTLFAVINYQGSNSANQRGGFGWNLSGYYWPGTNSADQVVCNGGGFASKYALGWGQEFTTLVGCTTSVSSGQRTITFTVQPKTTFGDFGAINDIAAFALDAAGNASGWLNHDLNFSSVRRLVSIIDCGLDASALQSRTKGTLIAWQQSCGAGFANFLRAAEFPADSLLTALQANDPSGLRTALAQPRAQWTAESGFTAEGALTKTLQTRAVTYLCNALLNPYNRTQIIEGYRLNAAPFSISTPLSCS